MLVKICGITRGMDALACARAGADMVGFIFAPSPRKVDAALARWAGSLLPEGVSRVGVFQNQPFEEVVRTSSLARIDYIQLHGEESPEFCESVYGATGARIIKAVKIVRGSDPAKLAAYALESVSFLLFDSPKDGRWREGERTHPWEILGEPPRIETPYLVAGGLTAENVGRALSRLSPAGVDVSSGVESSPGIKDITKVRRFIGEAKSHTPR